MYRLIFLSLGIGIIAQIIPQGCDLAALPGSPKPDERAALATQASAPEEASVGETVTLSASASGPVEGGAITYDWLQVGGAGVQITDPRQAEASFVAPSVPHDEVLAFMVVTTNDRGDVGRAEVNVLVHEDPDYGLNSGGTAALIARAGADREVPGGSLITLDGTNSRGTGTLEYEWTQVGGRSVTLNKANEVIANFIAPEYDPENVTRLVFELKVTDTRERVATDEIVLTVRERRTGDESDLKPRVRVKTSMGDFVVELDREKAPVTVQNFLRYVDDDFYDNTIFHRVIDDFVIQGGGFEPGLVEKETRDPIINEGDNGLRNDRGTIAMARTSAPDSATSQWYVNLKNNNSLNHTEGNPGYAVFGKVVSGMSVVDAIGRVETESREGYDDVPVQDVVVRDIVRIIETSANDPNGGDETNPDVGKLGNDG